MKWIEKSGTFEVKKKYLNYSRLLISSGSSVDWGLGDRNIIKSNHDAVFGYLWHQIPLDSLTLNRLWSDNLHFALGTWIETFGNITV